MLEQLKQDLAAVSNPAKAAFVAKYFKTGAGEYAEGDQFIGVTVPQIRKLIRTYRSLPYSDLPKLLHSPIHEHRLAALLIMVDQFEHADSQQQKKLLSVYLKSFAYINNWDLVDSSAPYILGAYLYTKSDRSLLDQLARAKNLWKQRAAIIATQYMIRRGEYADTLRIATALLHHEHDLIHKAVGWMLREVGNKDRATEEEFLRQHYKTMPRTMLRYAIEKFPTTLRQRYLTGRI